MIRFCEAKYQEVLQNFHVFFKIESYMSLKIGQVFSEERHEKGNKAPLFIVQQEFFSNYIVCCQTCSNLFILKTLNLRQEYFCKNYTV